MYIYLLIIVLFIIIYYLYNQTKDLTVYWFHKPNCKFCIEMEDEWKKVENNLLGSGIKYKRIDITNPKYKNLKDNFNIKTVPHIVKINADGTREIFKGDRKCNDIVAWIYENHIL